jgi:hypothetical protein
MTPDQFAAQIELLIATAREQGMSDEAMAAVLWDAVEALDEGVS